MGDIHLPPLSSDGASPRPGPRLGRPGLGRHHHPSIQHVHGWHHLGPESAPGAALSGCGQHNSLDSDPQIFHRLGARLFRVLSSTPGPLAPGPLRRRPAAKPSAPQMQWSPGCVFACRYYGILWP
eukprot:128512-Hanusia_phi.AAC.1